jgi:crotonobetainyl-CoA:carnitine CoA-transferase CaiB-like acyl-CoA transferase
MSFDKPYDGINVIDLSQGVAGPYCAMLLARHGADVIKVEPLEGDWSRSLGPQYGDNTAFTVAANLGKRSLAVDLKSKVGREIVERLIPTADVFLEGFRPGVIDRLGFGYDVLKAKNPGLIYLSISGFGQEGPLREKPAMDPILQAFTGFMAENKGPDGVPHRTPTIIIDMATGLYSHQAVVAALYAKAKGAPGRRINASLMEAAANLQSIRMMSAVRDGPFKNVAGPGGTYLASDGAWIQIAAIKNHEFEGVCKVLGLPDLLADPRFKTTTGRYTHGHELVERAAAVIKTKPAAHWRDLLTEAGLQNEIIQTYDEFVQHPHTEAIDLISWTTQPGSEQPWATPNPPGTRRLKSGDNEAISPRLGQHTREILAGLGFAAGDIERLVAEKVVKD